MCFMWIFGIRRAVEQALGGRRFDAVVDWVAFTPDQVQADIDLFAGKTGQYIFISSASAYQTPPANLPIREFDAAGKPVWEYSRNKIACEELLVQTYRRTHFPITIVRPSHTYDPGYVPLPGGFTDIDRMLHGKPVFVPGDGTSIWTLTHNTDFAKGFVGLLGKPRAMGEVFHITSDEWLTWNKIYQLLEMPPGSSLNWCISRPTSSLRTTGASVTASWAIKLTAPSSTTAKSNRLCLNLLRLCPSLLEPGRSSSGTWPTRADRKSTRLQRHGRPDAGELSQGLA